MSDNTTLETVEDSPQNMNVDSTGMLRIMSLFQRKSDNYDGGLEDYLIKLNDEDLTRIFRSSRIIQKIIKKYPEEAKVLGYKLYDKKGTVYDENNETLLEAFKEASIYARLYSRCFLVFEFNGEPSDKVLKKDSTLTGFSIHFDLVRKGDYYSYGTENYHYLKVLEFIGVKTYAKNITSTDEDYADSVIQGLYNSYMSFLENNEAAKFILKNISYLTIGIDNLGNYTMSTDGQNKVFNRLTSLNINRNITRTVAYDKKTEELNFISQTLAGIKDVIQEIKELFIADSEYPPTEIFETTPTQTLGSGIQNQLAARFLWSKKVRNWSINNWQVLFKIYFERLYDMTNYDLVIPFVVDKTDEEQAKIEKDGADRAKVLIDSKIIAPEEARTGYRENAYSLNIELDDELYKKYQDDQKEQNNLAAKLSGTSNPKYINNENVTDTDKLDSGNKKQQQKDSMNIPDDKFWDILANVTPDDLDLIGGKISKDSNEDGTIYASYPPLPLKGLYYLEDLDTTHIEQLFEIKFDFNEEFLYAYGYENLEELVTELDNTYGSDSYESISLLEILYQKNTDSLDDIQCDRGCPKDRIIRGDKGRFAGCASGSVSNLGTSANPNFKSKAQATKEAGAAKRVEKLAAKKTAIAEKTKARIAKLEAARQKKLQKSIERSEARKAKLEANKPPLTKRPREEFYKIGDKVDRSNHVELEKAGASYSDKYLRGFNFVSAKEKEKLKAADDVQKRLLEHHKKYGDGGTHTGEVKEKTTALLKELGEKNAIVQSANDAIKARQIKIMQQLKDDTLQRQIDRGVDSAKFPKLINSGSNRIKDEKMLKNVTNARNKVGTLAGGQGIQSAAKVELSDQRAFAIKPRDNQPGLINVGLGGRSKTFYHEYGHHLEFSQPELKKAATAWRDSKAESPTPKKLSELTGNKEYSKDEVALQDSYVSHYVGKVYKDGSTEVLSMGVERFADAQRMANLYSKDPSHFNFTLGALISK